MFVLKLEINAGEYTEELLRSQSWADVLECLRHLLDKCDPPHVYIVKHEQDDQRFPESPRQT